VPVAEHLVATTRDLDRSLLQWEHASWLWRRLQACIAGVMSLVLMPDHLHLVAAVEQRLRLIKVLAAFTAETGIRFDVRQPVVAYSSEIAGRMMRYGFFNPVRKRLVDDPFRWAWSTLRDLVGATHPCWTPLSSVASVLGLPPASALLGLTTVSNKRIAPPSPSRVEIAALDGIRVAVSSAVRIPTAEVLRRPLGLRLAIQACNVIAGPAARRLAAELGCSERTIHRCRQPRHPALDAVLLCLADGRLRDGWDPPQTPR